MSVLVTEGRFVGKTAVLKVGRDYTGFTPYEMDVVSFALDNNFVVVDRMVFKVNLGCTTEPVSSPAFPVPLEDVAWLQKCDPDTTTDVLSIHAKLK